MIGIVIAANAYKEKKNTLYKIIRTVKDEPGKFSHVIGNLGERTSSCYYDCSMYIKEHQSEINNEYSLLFFTASNEYSRVVHVAISKGNELVTPLDKKNKASVVNNIYECESRVLKGAHLSGKVEASELAILLTTKSEEDFNKAYENLNNI